jgi:hypothetical protein
LKSFLARLPHSGEALDSLAKALVAEGSNSDPSKGICIHILTRALREGLESLVVTGKESARIRRGLLVLKVLLDMLLNLSE